MNKAGVVGVAGEEDGGGLVVFFAVGCDEEDDGKEDEVEEKSFALLELENKAEPVSLENREEPAVLPVELDEPADPKLANG